MAQRARVLLEDRYGERAGPVADNLERWLSGGVEFAEPEILARHVEAERASLLYDTFWRVLPFGTGGRRGPVGYGPNRLNHATVALTIQGHCQFLNHKFKDESERTVVVANDVRVFGDVAGVYGFLDDHHPLAGVTSRDFARFACEIYAGNGIVAYLEAPDEAGGLLTTPELSFAITYLHALGGVNFSASHNPPDDNGAKVYDERGAQPIPPHDQELANLMEHQPEINRMQFEEGRRQGLIREMPTEVRAAYRKKYVDRYGSVVEPAADVPIVYTPLCGCGLRTVGAVLEELSFPVHVPPDQGPDGSFKVIPFRAPNPEVPQATTPAKEFADERGGEIVISSDPDADRVGVDVKVGDRWIHLTGNQIAAILTYFLMLDPEGPQRRGLVIETLVTTKLVGEIARQAGQSQVIDDLLVGFKYIADVLAKLEADGSYKGITARQDDLVIAAEESHGIMIVPSIREKDATPAAMYMAALHQRLRSQGSDLYAYFNRIIDRLGGFAETTRSILAAGDEGVQLIDEIMRSVRDHPPGEVGGRKVTEVRDYWDEDVLGELVSDTDRLSRNVVQVFMEGFVLTIRPSGTEPKLKLYSHALPQGSSNGGGLDEASRRAADMATDAYVQLLGLAGISLGKAALRLPDIIQLRDKQRFDSETLPGLLEALEEDRFGSLDEALQWLREQTAAMTPGADPLPAVKDAVAAALEDADVTGGVVDELRRWTGT
jgi:phosphoglucomutase